MQPATSQVASLLRGSVTHAHTHTQDVTRGPWVGSQHDDAFTVLPEVLKILPRRRSFCPHRSELENEAPPPSPSVPDLHTYSITGRNVA